MEINITHAWHSKPSSSFRGEKLIYLGEAGLNSKSPEFTNPGDRDEWLVKARGYYDNMVEGTVVELDREERKRIFIEYLGEIDDDLLAQSTENSPHLLLKQNAHLKERYKEKSRENANLQNRIDKLEGDASVTIDGPGVLQFQDDAPKKKPKKAPKKAAPPAKKKDGRCHHTKDDGARCKNKTDGLYCHIKSHSPN